MREAHSTSLGPLGPAVPETVPGVFSYISRRVPFFAQTILSRFLRLATSRALIDEKNQVGFYKRGDILGWVLKDE